MFSALDRHLLTVLFSLAVCRLTAEPAVSAYTPDRTVELLSAPLLATWQAVTAMDSDGDSLDWTLQDGILRTGGLTMGYFRTRQAFADYRLVLEWRWAEGPRQILPNGKVRPRNSGIFVHVETPDKVWPRCFEVQLRDTDAGSIIAMEGSTCREVDLLRARLMSQAGSDSAALLKAREAKVITKDKKGLERPVGEWNRLEVVCRGDTITCSVNGVPQTHITNTNPKAGFIALQSEGAPIEFRNVRLEPL